jgi:hypothetical protein
MANLAHRASQSITYFSKALGLSQLAKEHGYKLIPGSEPLRIALGLFSASRAYPVRKGAVIRINVGWETRAKPEA